MSIFTKSVKIFLLTGALAAIFSRCKSWYSDQGRTIHFSDLKRYQNDGARTFIYLKMIKIYPATSKCIYPPKFANLYLTRRPDGQRLYVFEFCREVSDELYDTTGRYPPIIDTTTIEKERRDSAVIFVPKDFSIPSGSSYVIAQMSYITEM